eukprot:1267393-Rhodomonas_salina.1
MRQSLRGKPVVLSDRTASAKRQSTPSRGKATHVHGVMLLGLNSDAPRGVSASVSSRGHLSRPLQ